MPLLPLLSPVQPHAASLLILMAWLVIGNSASASVVVSTTNRLGAVPLNPPWSAAGNSLLAGLAPTFSNGNFGEYTGANVTNLTTPGVSLTINPYASAPNMEVAGNDGTAGNLLVYTLPASTYGYDVTNITIYGGWQDAGRDSQDYSVFYSTPVNPGLFFALTNVSYNPSNPGSTGCANRVTISDSAGAAIARNVAAVKFDFSIPPAENGACGYTAITVQGTASTNLSAPPIAKTYSNQHSNASFIPTWSIETDSLIAGQIPSVGSGSFTYEPGVTGVSALTDGMFGPVDGRASYATCGSLAGQSVTYALSAAMITNIVVYSGWLDQNRDGQFFNIYYSTAAAPSTFVPLTSISNNPAVTGVSANRVAITATNGAALATNVAFLRFDFTPQTGGLDNGYSGYAEIIVEGTNGPSAQPIWGASPVPEPYPYVRLGSFSGPAVPLSPDPLVAYRWANPQASDGLEVYLRKPQSVTADANSSFVNLQSLLSTNPNVTVNGPGSIQIDFGAENAAWLEFDSPDLTGAVTMSISEYNMPGITGNGAAHSVKTLAPSKYGNSYRLELNSQLYEGVRFGWIHVTSFTAPWHITGLRLVCQNKPANYNGRFSCSDDLLTRIWYAAAYTVKLNLLRDYFGAILIDRGDRISWTGDAHCSQAAALVAFGNNDFIKKNLDLTAGDNNGILSYALYWVLSVIDYYNYTGDTPTLLGYLNNAQGILDGAYAVYGTNPGLGFYGWDERLGAGFENANCPEAQNAYKMLAIRAWTQFAAAMAACGRTDLQAKYNGYANQKIAALRQNASWYQGFGLHACADAVNTGLLNGSEQNAIFQQQFTDRVNRVSYSPFNQYFVIQAFAGMNKYDDALSSINDLWGSEITYGGTTFFEVSHPSWNAGIGINDPVPNAQCGYTSLCHPWSAGVVKWLNEEILGIKPTSPGFQTYQIHPHLGSTLTFVSGTTPTPFGGIQATFNVSNGLCAVSAPPGTTGIVGIPKVGKAINSISINGTLAWDGAFHPVGGIGGANQDSEFVYFTGVQPGAYSIAVSYSGSTPVYNEPPVQYAAQFIKQDSSTRGNWGGVYGKYGYVLCNYNGNGNDVSSLPSFVSSVINNAPHSTVWTAGTNDPRALAPNSNNQNPRNAACVYTDQGNTPTMTFTITTTGTTNYQVALYFVDWDNRGRQLAVEMFDAATLNLIAPVKVVKNFYGGCYLVYACNKSIKFRLDHVRGDNAVLSGIFFDPAPTNTAPGLAAISDKYVHVGQTVAFTATATDAESAYQTLTFSLTNSPAGATINASSGAFVWVTTNAIAPSTNRATVRVTDNGLPPLSDTKTFSVVVAGPPQFTGISPRPNAQVELFFTTLPGQKYQVQFKNNLADGLWSSLGGIIFALSSSTNVYDDMLGLPQRFYRLMVSP